MLQALPVMVKSRVVIGAMVAKATVRLVVVGVGAPTMQDIVTGDPEALVQVPPVMVRFKEVIGVTRTKATVRLVVAVAGVARPVEVGVLEEKTQNALAVAGIMGQTALTNGVMGANQTAKSALVHGLEEDQSARVVAGTMG
eukprot:CCRYP_012265-RA/>CCRYP_012265-RA protein AED:0.00 eAED:0.00 QI:23/1/1/1/1/1/2/870/140